MRVVSVNIGAVGEVEIRGGRVASAIDKRPQAGPVRVDANGLVGDHLVESRAQFGREAHAVHVYPSEHYPRWQRVATRALAFGALGENLTCEGLLESDACIGDVLRFGGATLQVTQPRIPCRKLNARVGASIARDFVVERRTGFYLRVLVPGEVRAGDAIALLDRVPDAPSVDEFVRVTQRDYWDAAALDRCARARGLPARWRTQLLEKRDRAASAVGWFGERELVVEAADADDEGFVTYTLACARGVSLPAYQPGQALLTAPPGTPAQHVVRMSLPLSPGPPGSARYHVTARGIDGALHPGARVRALAPSGLDVLGAIPPSASAILVISAGLGLVRAAALILAARARNPERVVAAFHDDTDGTPALAFAALEALCARDPGVQVWRGSLGRCADEAPPSRAGVASRLGAHPVVLVVGDAALDAAVPGVLSELGLAAPQLPALRVYED